MMRSFRLFLWLCRFLALFLLFSDHAVGAVQRGFVNLGFESPVISSAAPCRASIGFELIPGWVTDHPLDTQGIPALHIQEMRGLSSFGEAPAR